MNDDYKQQNPSPETDPYEKGFAEKLYEDYDDTEYFVPSQPTHRNRDYNLNRRGDRGIQQFQQVYSPNEDSPMEFPRENSSDADYRIPKKKRHPIRRFFRKLLLWVIILMLIGGGLLYVLARPPKGDAPLGEHSKDSCTILLAGTDESGDRTDTIMLMNVNKETDRISFMSIPRDTKVNSSYVPHQINIAYGVNGKGEEGMEALMDYVADCIGFRPDGYVLLELDAFVDLVDLFGGVEFDVPIDMFYEDSSQDLYINIEKGVQTLNGEQAMGLVRFRYGYADADLGRVRVQRDFMKSAISQWISVKNLYKAPSAAALLLRNSVTDLSIGNLTWLAKAVLSCEKGDMYTTTIPYYLTDSYVIVDAGDSYLDMLNTYFNPYYENITMDCLNIAY